MKYSLRTWKNKFEEWGYVKKTPKNVMEFIVAKGTKRKLEGKDTIFFHRGNEVGTEKINNFKRRKTSGAAPSIGEYVCTESYS